MGMRSLRSPILRVLIVLAALLLPSRGWASCQAEFGAYRELVNTHPATDAEREALNIERERLKAIWDNCVKAEQAKAEEEARYMQYELQRGRALTEMTSQPLETETTGTGQVDASRPSTAATPVPTPVPRPACLSPSDAATKPECRSETNAARTTTSPTPAPTPTANPRRAETGDTASGDPELERLFEECRTKGARTVTDCSTDRARTTATASSTAGLSTQEACQQAAGTASAANSALSSARASCQASYAACANVCQSAQARINAMNDGSRKSGYQNRLGPFRHSCESALTRLQGIDQDLASVQRVMSQNQACANDVTTDTTTAMAPMNGGYETASIQNMVATCASNPSLPQCVQLKQDCTNPQFAASNAVCACMSNPGDARCRGAMADQASLPTTGRESMGGPAAFGGLDPVGGGIGGPTEPGAAPSFQDSYQQNPVISGGAAAHGGGSASAVGGSAVAGPDSPRSGVDPHILATGRGGRGPSGPGHSSAGGSYRDNGSWIPPKVSAKNDGAESVDLNRFRPGAMQMRAPASANRHGILPAHVNIWRQMNFRYSNISATLMP